MTHRDDACDALRGQGTMVMHCKPSSPEVASKPPGARNRQEKWMNLKPPKTLAKSLVVHAKSF